ncbi:MAG: SIR2 family protein [Pseudomonadota bacterium]|nr:SIR2 family protein [Pseudomonadota bacterium]
MFTTNFDDLVNEALTTFLGYNPVVCAADSEVATISVMSERAKIVKLHGDYLFDRLKNTEQELDQLDPNMAAKFRQFARLCGLVVIGYKGNDRSVMTVIDALLQEPEAFPRHIWWGLRPGEKPAERVASLAAALPKRFRLFECRSFDSLMAQLHAELKLSLPDSVVAPYTAVEKQLLKLVDNPSPELESEPRRRASKPVARCARLAVGTGVRHVQAGSIECSACVGTARRRDRGAIRRQVCREASQRRACLTVWGDALHLQFENAGIDTLREQAVGKWREAVERDPNYAPPRARLASHYRLKHQFNEAIEQCEAWQKIARTDRVLKRNLAQLYGAAARYEEAQ